MAIAPPAVLTLQCADQPGIVAAVANLIADVGRQHRQRRSAHRPGVERLPPAHRARRCRSSGVLRPGPRRAGRALRHAVGAAPPGVAGPGRRRLLGRALLRRRPPQPGGAGRARRRRGRPGLRQGGGRPVGGPPRRALRPRRRLGSSGEERAAQEAAFADELAELAPDLVVLARYMRILPEAITEAWSGRMINIHHSFLPAFPGARPVPPGPPAGCEAHRGHRPLRHRRARCRSDHRPGRGHRDPPRRGRATSSARAVTSSARRWPTRCASTSSTGCWSGTTAPASSPDPAPPRPSARRSATRWRVRAIASGTRWRIVWVRRVEGERSS